MSRLSGSPSGGAVALGKGTVVFKELRAELDLFWASFVEELCSFQSEVESILTADPKLDPKLQSKADKIKEKLEAWAADSHRRSQVEVFAEDARDEADVDLSALGRKAAADCQLLPPTDDDMRSIASTYFDMDATRSEEMLLLPSGGQRLATLLPIEMSVLLVTPRVAMHSDGPKHIYEALIDAQYHIADFHEVVLSEAHANELLSADSFRRQRSAAELKAICSEMTSDKSLVMKVFRVDAIRHLVDLCTNTPLVGRLLGDCRFSGARIALFPAQSQSQVRFLREIGFAEAPKAHDSEYLAEAKIANNRAVVVIKPKAAEKSADAIRAEIVGSDFRIVFEKWIKISEAMAKKMALNSEMRTGPTTRKGAMRSDLKKASVAYLSSRPVVAVVVERALHSSSDSPFYEDLSAVIGPPAVAEFGGETEDDSHANSIRAYYGVDDVHNVCEVTLNWEDYCTQVQVLFPAAVSELTSKSADVLKRLQSTVSQRRREDSRGLGDLGPLPTADSGFEEAVVVVKAHVCRGDRALVQARIRREGLAVFDELPHAVCGFDEVSAIWAQRKSQTEIPAMLRAKLKRNWDATRDECQVYRVKGRDAFRKLAAIFGHLDPEVAVREDPDCVRAVHGRDRVRNVALVTDSLQSTAAASRLLYDTKAVDQKQRAIVLVKPHITAERTRDIKRMLKDAGLKLLRQSQLRLSASVLEPMLSTLGYKGAVLRPLVAHMSSAEMTCILVRSRSAEPHCDTFTLLAKVMGSEQPSVARMRDPHSIRARFGVDLVRNACLYTDCAESCSLLFDRLLPGDAQSLPCSEQRAVLVCLPHLDEAAVAQVLEVLEANGFTLEKKVKVQLPKASAEALCQFQGYKASILSKMATQLLCGECTALRLRRSDAYSTLQQLVGAAIPDIARMQNPASIRAVLGVDTVRNAVLYSRDESEFCKMRPHFFFERSAVSVGFERSGASLVSGSTVSQGSKHSSAFDAYGRGRAIVVVKPHVDGVGRAEVRRLLADSCLKVVRSSELHLPSTAFEKALRLDGYVKAILRKSAAHMASAPILALLVVYSLTADGDEDTYEALARVCGPKEPTVAKLGSPDSIRALLGETMIKNAVYFTRTPETYQLMFSEVFFDGSDDALKEP